MAVGGNNHTTVLSEWLKAPFSKTFCSRQCDCNDWKSFSVWTAGDGIAGDDSITLGGERKVPEEGRLSGGRSMITRNDGNVLRGTSRSFSNEKDGKYERLL